MASSISPITSGATTATPTTSGAALSSSDFMHLMITQLQHQDPLSPTDSNALLQQIAQISTLQSNQTLQTSLSSLTLQQSIGAGGNLIGKSVEGLDTNGNKSAGNVIGVQVQNQKVYLALDSGAVMPMENIMTIAPAVVTPAAASAAAAATPATGTSDIAQKIINALSGLTGG